MFKVYDIVPGGMEKELNGLINAARSFGLKEGTIVTYDEEDSVGEGIIPFFKFVTSL